MKDKIREFLATSGGQASAAAIGQKVLHLTNASPVTAERVLSSLLQNDPAFAADGLGNWHLLSGAGDPNAQAGVKILLVGTPMSPREIARAPSIVLAWAAFEEDAEAALTAAEIVCGADSAPGAEDYQRMTPEEFTARLGAAEGDLVLVTWQPQAIARAWRKIFSQKGEPWLLPTIISLPTLARNALELNRRPALPALYRQLCGVAIWRESLTDSLRAQAEILRALLEKCRVRGISRWPQIAVLARRPRRADFSAYAFDEKFIDTLPETPGAYVMRNARGHAVYVGKAANLRQRVRSYFQSPAPEERKLREIRAQIAALHYETVDTELDALLREHRLIQRLKPPANRQKKIFPAPLPQSARLQCIFLVPVFPKTPTTKGRVIVYLLSACSLKRYSVALGRKPGARLLRGLAEFYAEIASPEKKRAYLANNTRERLEIAARWLHQNADRINVLDPADCAGEQELERRLLLLLRSAETMAEKVHFTAAPMAV